MNIILLGYMSSGKSTVGKALAHQLNTRFIDLDEQISSKVGMSISELFQKKGELYFRKVEHETLKEILETSTKQDYVLALGGGTPCYYNNVELILQAKNTTSIYFKISIDQLLQRLWNEKESRPLISHYGDDREGLEEFIRKHLFERQYYYLKSNHILDVSKLDIFSTIKAILQILEKQ